MRHRLAKKLHRRWFTDEQGNLPFFKLSRGLDEFDKKWVERLKRFLRRNPSCRAALRIALSDLICDTTRIGDG